MICAAEIVAQAEAIGRPFDYIVHCTGSSSTQAGLLAGLRALGSDTRVIGIADDEETAIKALRVRQLANDALALLALEERVPEDAVTVVTADKSPYGIADDRTMESIRQFASDEGLLADPVYEGKALRGLRDLAEAGHFEADARILVMHLGGTPAVHAYANQFGIPPLKDIGTDRGR
jgi:1-aminocyclopropane-1-carboxylate deaminase/D-cysteine desulfhydrase-like pyridoxal-dependent ACC family enzyme